MVSELEEMKARAEELRLIRYPKGATADELLDAVADNAQRRMDCLLRAIAIAEEAFNWWALALKERDEAQAAVLALRDDLKAFAGDSRQVLTDTESYEQYR